ncbi:MAG: VWA domain-containing protein [bacterium]|nr:VWA domain-containing protein [bacterium]
MNTRNQNGSAQEAKSGKTRRRQRAQSRRRIVVITIAIAAVAAALGYQWTGTIEGLAQPANGDATSLRQLLVNKASGRTPHYSIYRIREGIERFFISDINNPAASAVAQSDSRPRRRWRKGPPPVHHTVNVTVQQAPPPPPVIHVQPPAVVQVQVAQADVVAPTGSGWDPFNTEQYDHYEDNPFKWVKDDPVSTFSIDVDTASYSNVRRMIQMGARPPRDAVRIEEFINYFTYDYPVPDKDTPFSVNVEMASAPWQPEHRLVRIGLRGYEPPQDERPACNLVFLIDVSGSMRPANKLPLVKRSLKYLVKQLDHRDRVALCVYAGAAGMVLPPTSCSKKSAILHAINRLEAGGSTNGGQGIHLAYDLVRQNFRRGAVNRVIIATDGDFNVGTTDRGELIRFIEKRAKEGVFLTTLGYGFGNIKDGTLEQLADKGNGNYGYVDSFDEAKRILGKKMAATLVAIAKDVKIQVEFNPTEAAGYRLIGYVNRMLAREDFNDDTKDAGEIGAGHTVTALYEVIPAGLDVPAASVDPLRYQTAAEESSAAWSGELFHLKLRYKTPSADKSQLLTTPVRDAKIAFEDASPDFRFATAVATFGMMLRGATPSEDLDFVAVHKWARRTMDGETSEERREFLDLVEAASELQG